MLEIKFLFNDGQQYLYDRSRWEHVPKHRGRPQNRSSRGRDDAEAASKELLHLIDRHNPQIPTLLLSKLGSGESVALYNPQRVLR